jgi:hypothetical protein
MSSKPLTAWFKRDDVPREREHDLDGAVGSQDYVRREGNYLRRTLMEAAGVSGSPAGFYLHVLGILPAEVRQRLYKRDQTCLPFFVICSQGSRGSGRYGRSSFASLGCRRKLTAPVRHRAAEGCP